MTAARDSRHVLHARMRISAGAPRNTLIFRMEEALRLCSLPGENEGRAYYFRRLHVAGLPEDGDRRTWQDAFQRAMLELARQAVYGAHAAALAAEVVYFTSEQEACEWLLRSMVPPVARGSVTHAWIRSAISGTSPAADESAQIVSVIEKLSQSAASWIAVAAAIFHLENPAQLLARIPESTARIWLREFGRDDEASPPPSPSFHIQPRLIEPTGQAVRMLGADDPRTVFLAALAVILTEPSQIERGTSVRYAGRVLRALTNANPEATHSSSARTHRALSGELAKHKTLPAKPPTAAATDQLTRERTAPTSAPDKVAEEQSRQPHSRAHHEALLQDPRTGAPTQAAGLYFLLNALRALNIADAQLSIPFLAHLFRFIANHAGVGSEDPILLWTELALEEHNVEATAGKPDPRAIRIHAWKVRRWCWKNARISVREIVRRPGLVTISRTDLDVSLSLDSVDLRIRRAGLDLDPGWLPWFGRVVRFHYSWRGELP